MIRIYNARILTMVPGEELFRGEIHVQGDRIAWIGEKPPRDAGPFEREIDAGGDLILPGFKNAHTHSPMTFLRSFADDLPLSEWLNQKVFPMEERLTGSAIRLFAKIAFLEYLTSGITAAFDMYLDPDAVAEAARETGFRTVIVGGMNNFTHSLAQQEQWYKTYNEPDSLVSYRLGFHAEYTTSLELMEGLAELAETYRAPVFAHNSETASEVRDCVGRYGRTPTGLMEELGLFRHGGGGYHCIYLSEEDKEIFRERGLFAVTCPGSNLKLASGIAPVADLLARGIPVAIGTDGAASNNCLDMFREMFLVTGLAKLKAGDASALPAPEVLRMATVYGAAAMGLSDCDVLAEGKKADLIRIGLRQPNMQPVSRIPENLVYSGSKQNVRMTMIGGKILYEDGAFFLGEEPEELYRKANEATAALRAGI